MVIQIQANKCLI